MNGKAALIAFAEDYLKSNSIPIHRITLPCIDYTWMDFGLRSALPDHQGYRSIQNYLESVEPNTIHHLADTLGCIYTIFRLPDSFELMVCGPVLFGNESLPVRSAQKQSGAPVQAVPALQYYYAQIAVFQQPMLYYSLFKTLSGHIFDVGACKIVHDSLGDLECWYEVYQQNLNLPEDPALKLQAVERWYSMEEKLMWALCNGNEFDVLDAVSKLQSIILPPLLTDELQNTKACLVALETLLRKSAQIAGAPPILLDPYSRQHIQLIGQIMSKTDMNILLMQFSQDYYRLTRQHSIKQYSLLIQKIMTLIVQDITADLSLSAISEKLNANKKYLSDLFRREVGITLTDYVSKRRIELAKRLLFLTDLPIKTVAQTCGIPDVHYFSHQFKRRVGCTPKFFRENHLKNI